MINKSRGPGPPKSTGGWVLVMTFIFFLFETASSEENKIYDMQTLCEDRFRQALYRKIDGAYLKSQNERNLDCIVTFQTHSILQRFMLRFDFLHLDCNDHLFIYDGAHAVESYKINILHDEPWPTTVTTASHIEVLTILKENFQTILEEFLGQQKREITECLNQFLYFKDWSQRTVVECCILARVLHCQRDDLILGDNHGDLENSYFIVSGSCRVVYFLQVKHIPRKLYTELKVIDPNIITEDDIFPTSYTLKNMERPKIKKIAEPLVTGLIVDRLLTDLLAEIPISDPNYRKTGGSGVDHYVQSHFFQVAELFTGACFGVGEILDKKYILCSSHTATLLCIPKHFLKMHDLTDTWGRVRAMYNHMYPSPHVIFNQFSIDRKYERSRAKYLESLIKIDRPFTGLTSAEAPYYTRLTTDYDNPIFVRLKKVFKDSKNNGFGIGQ